jgi:hypothetical protein
MKTKFSHNGHRPRRGTKTQRKHEELRNEQTTNVCMIFFVPSRLRGIFGSGLSGLSSDTVLDQRGQQRGLYDTVLIML